MEATRETFGNIPAWSQWLFYVAAAAAMAIFWYGMWRRFRLWRLGQSINARELLFGNVRQILGKIRPGAQRLLVEGLGQKRVRGRGLAGSAHIVMFAGFMALLLGTTLLEIDHLAAMVSSALKFHHGLYYITYEFTLDVFGLLFLAGCVFFLGRRTRRPASVGHRTTDWFVLGGLIAIGVTGYLVEGLRIAWQHPEGVAAKCSPVGLWISSWFSGLGDQGARRAHFGLWWVHSLLVFGFIGSIPYTRLRHFIAGPLNLFFALPGLGRLHPISIEDLEQKGRVGVSHPRHFTQQQLLSLDACMECGRCEEVCPAFATAKPLSPKKVVQDLKAAMQGLDANESLPSEQSRTLHEQMIAAETLWSCTACSACVYVCPVRVDPLTLIFDLRRHLVAEGGLSGTAATALRRMQSAGNPWGLPGPERAQWVESLHTRPAKPADETTPIS